MNTHKAIQVLTALAQEHRLAIFRLLVRQGPSGLPAGEISRMAGISPTNTSFHLKELERSGLITATRKGRFIRYAFAPAVMSALMTFLTEDCCQGNPEICGNLVTAAQTNCQKQKDTVS